MSQLFRGERTSGVPIASHLVPDAATITAGLEAEKARAQEEEAKQAEAGLSSPDALQEPMSPHGAWSPATRRREMGTATVDLVWFQAKVAHEQDQRRSRRQNCEAHIPLRLRSGQPRAAALLAH